MSKTILLIDDNFHSVNKGAFLNSYERAFLPEHGFKVYTLSFPPTMPEDRTDNDFAFVMPSSRVDEKRIKFIGSRAASEFVKQSIKRVQPDLIHCHLLSKCPASVYDGIEKNIPVIQTLHGPNFFCSTSWGCYPNSGPCELGVGPKCFIRGCVPLVHSLLYMNLTRRLWRNMTDKVNVFHCPSRNIMNTALRLGLNNVQHIPCGINQKFMEIDRKIPTGKPTAIFVGSLVKSKGVDVLIKAMKIVTASVPDAHLLIAGVGDMQAQLVGKVEEAGLEDSITFLGHISHADLIEAFEHADVLVIPSVWQEQFGLVGPEAMACGLPCIGSDIGGIPEWLHHEKWGVLVPPGSVQHLANAVVKYLGNREYAFIQGLNGQKYACESFGPKNYASSIVGLIQKLIYENERRQ